jgi:hypothetical protein
MKNTFILYTDVIHTVKKLDDVSVGKLFKIILEFVNGNEVEIEDIVLQIAFEPIKINLIRMGVKYEEKCVKNKENIKKRWEKINKEESQVSNEDIKVTVPIQTEMKNIQSNTTIYDRIRPYTKHTDNDTDTDSDSDSDSDTDNDILLHKCNNINNILPEKKFSGEIISLFEEVINYFPENITSKLTSSGRKNWMKTLEKLIRIDKYKYDEIVQIIKSTRRDDFWQTNFLSVIKLRNTDKNGTKYIDVFNERFKKKKTGILITETDVKNFNGDDPERLKFKRNGNY